MDINKHFMFESKAMILFPIGLILMGLLAAIIVPQFSDRLDCIITEEENDLRTLRNSIDLYYLDNKKHPNELGELLNYKGISYSKNIPIDKWGNEYVYFYPPKYTDGKYDLGTFGADAKFGGIEEAKDTFIQDSKLFSNMPKKLDRK